MIKILAKLALQEQRNNLSLKYQASTIIKKNYLTKTYSFNLHLDTSKPIKNLYLKILLSRLGKGIYVVDENPLKLFKLINNYG